MVFKSELITYPFCGTYDINAQYSIYSFYCKSFVNRGQTKLRLLAGESYYKVTPYCDYVYILRRLTVCFIFNTDKMIELIT